MVIFVCLWSIFLIPVVHGGMFLDNCIDGINYDFSCRFLAICTCCKGWTKDNYGVCQKGLPENHQPPKIHYCPKERIALKVGPFTNIVFLPNPGITAEDWGGQPLHVKLSKDVFHHCVCPYPHQPELVTATAVDKYGGVATCNFSVIVNDNYDPVFDNCPSSKLYSYTEKVTWLAPKVTDNIGIQRLEKPELSNNTRHQPGRYELVYQAFDWDNNVAICSFTVTVIKETYEVKNSSINDQSLIISATIVGALIIVLTVMGMAFIRLCRKRQQLEHTRRRHRLCRHPTSCVHQNEPTDRPDFPLSSIPVEDGNDNPVFAIYSNNPPPYEIATTDKLPDYSPRADPPPYTEFEESRDWSENGFDDNSRQEEDSGANEFRETLNIDSQASEEISYQTNRIHGRIPVANHIITFGHRQTTV